MTLLDKNFTRAEPGLLRAKYFLWQNFGLLKQTTKKSMYAGIYRQPSAWYLPVKIISAAFFLYKKYLKIVVCVANPRRKLREAA
jgi:hypothetical protein